MDDFFDWASIVVGILQILVGVWAALRGEEHSKPKHSKRHKK